MIEFRSGNIYTETSHGDFEKQKLRIFSELHVNDLQKSQWEDSDFLESGVTTR
jgi:hypothetical protein